MGLVMDNDGKLFGERRKKQRRQKEKDVKNERRVKVEKGRRKEDKE